MSSIEDRAKQLISKAGFDRLIRESEIGHARWKSVRYRNIRISTNELEVLERLFPAYALWLISGKIAPEVGQTSPDYDQEQREKKLKDGRSRGETTCEECGKKITCDDVRVSEEYRLGSKNNRFMVVCDACNAKIGQGKNENR